LSDTREVRELRNEWERWLIPPTIARRSLL